MATKSRTAVIVWGILLRIAFLVVAALLAFYTAPFFLNFLEKLGYQAPDFFGYTLDDLLDSWIVSLVVWSGILFGTLGKKIDYIFIVLLFLVSLFVFYGYGLNIYLGLLGATFLANAIGFALKLARQKFLPNIRI